MISDLYISFDDFISTIRNSSDVLLAPTDLFNVHFKIDLLSFAKYFIPPVVFASRLIVCSPLESTAVLTNIDPELGRISHFRSEAVWHRV